MLSWRVTFYIGSVHPLQAVPFSDFWTDFQQDTAFVGCQISLQKCNSFQRKTASFCRGSFICIRFCSQMCTLRKIVSQKISEAAFTMPQAFARPKRNTTKLPWTKCSSGLVGGRSFPLNQQIEIRLSNSKLSYAAGVCSASPAFTGTELPFWHPWHWGSLQQYSSVLVWEYSHQAEHPPLPHFDWACNHTDNHTFLLSSVMGRKNRQKKAPSSSISWLQHLAGIYGYENGR